MPRTSRGLAQLYAAAIAAAWIAGGLGLALLGGDFAAGYVLCGLGAALALLLVVDLLVEGR